MASNLSFTHPQVGTLIVSVNPDSIQWAYNLNTVTFPTYKGEVVQILSVFIDDLTIEGELSSQREMENIYAFFAQYMTIASQGHGGNTPGGTFYDQNPMTLHYLPRNWSFKIQPKSAPGFAYGLEIIAPQWGIVAHVVDDSGDVEAIKDLIAAQVSSSTGDDDNPADIGSGIFSISSLISPNSGNPNTNPFQTYVASNTQTSLQQISKSENYFNSIIPSYMKGDFSSVWDGIGSSPSFGDYGGKSQGQKQVAAPKKKKKS
jgi:hypothetical protein